jgi:hypothetical protein
MEFTDAAQRLPLVMTLPMPDGTFARFRIEESPIMEPGLAVQFPEIKTYQALGIDDPTATSRFDWTPLGLHAIVLSARGTSFVEPLSEADTTNYTTYFNQDVSTDKLLLSCQVSESEIADAETRGVLVSQQFQAANFVTGSTLRTYRLAVAATAEFTQQYGAGSVATTLTKITTLINQVNAVYQKEATIRFQLIANETNIIFTDPAIYTNATPSTMLAENQTKLDAVIGSANYDIGHVFGGISVSPGFISFSGVASIGVACATGSKGRGVSTMGGASSSFPHSIFVSGVTHEIGHQFSALHTFNSTTGGCAGQRSASGAYEPGSGSTIMGYSICGADNLQNLPDLYFHTGSVERIVNYAAAGGNCAATTATGNGPPIIPTLSNFTIPASTPFVLTGSATDPDGDALTYSWEEYDLGNASPPNTDDGTRPLFRSFPPSTNPSRTFPRLQYILNTSNVPPSGYACGGSTCFTGELLPSTTRTMNFRFTAHDDKPSGGGSISANQQVSVVSTAGPFAVTQPNTAVSWPGGAPQVITWNVASTSGAPISAANVKISLSTDGGNTFPTVLAASTPNDGTETVAVPSISTTMARIKVEAVGNIFFDISDTNFTITSTGIQVTVQSNPNGRSFTVDGTLYSTAQIFSWIPSSSHTISTTTPQSGGAGVQYVWSNWSDGGAISHSVSPGSNTTYTVNFATQFFLTMTAGAGGTVTPASNWFNSGQSVSITAFANGGFAFTGWTGTGAGSFTGSTNPASVTMNGPITEAASFASATRTLTVSSSNPASGVSITVSPNDNNGQGNGVTQFTRVYNTGSVVTLTAPATVGGSDFLKWQRDGVDLTTSIATNVTMDADHTMTAVYDKTQFDFDADKKADISIFRPTDSSWWILKSSDGTQLNRQWGATGDKVVPGDYDGDGTADIAVFRPSNGTWWILRSSDGGTTVQQFAAPGDVPMPGDYDGDGKTDIAVFRPSNSTWLILNSTDGTQTFRQWGATGDQLVPTDYDGDGKTDIAVFRPSNGTWWILRSSDGGATVKQFAITGDIPVPGDYDGDKKSDIAIWRPSDGTWWILKSTDGTQLVRQWGVAGDKLVPADYDGDGKIDLAMFRPSNGTWWILRSSDGGTTLKQFALTGDIPVESAYQQ